MNRQVQFDIGVIGHEYLLDIVIIHENRHSLVIYLLNEVILCDGAIFDRVVEFIKKSMNMTHSQKSREVNGRFARRISDLTVPEESGESEDLFSLSHRNTPGGYKDIEGTAELQLAHLFVITALVPGQVCFSQEHVVIQIEVVFAQHSSHIVCLVIQNFRGQVFQFRGF